MNEIDTIAAIITPFGNGAVGIVRISGALSINLAYEIIRKLPRPRFAEYSSFFNNDGSVLDKGISLFFPKPHSYTGEDILEFQGHGGVVILNLLLNRVVSFPGIRLALPGEFSYRAFLNDKIDLVQAESISDLINATSNRTAKLAMHSLEGSFSKKINILIKKIMTIRVQLEAEINFPDENINFFCKKKLQRKIKNIVHNLFLLFNKSKENHLLFDGVKIVLVGKPNVGKSSILNALSKKEIAIVTNEAGTTRDILREKIYINGILINIADTAGFQNSVNTQAERIGIKKTWKEIEIADHILIVIDNTNDLNFLNVLISKIVNLSLKKSLITIIKNKSDITGEVEEIKKINGYTIITLSAKYGKGIDLLSKYLSENFSFDINDESKFMVNQRHLNSLKNAFLQIKNKEKLVYNTSYELLLEDLKISQRYLEEIIGKSNQSNLLKKIFSNFCIGK